MRILKVAVIVMGVLLVGGFAFVLAAIVYQASHSAQDKGMAAAAGAHGEGSFELPIPRNAAVTSLALDGNRLAVNLNGTEGPEILVIDLGSGKVAARIKLKPH